MATDVKVPALGESITEATLGAWLKQPGDAVAVDEALASLETDKVAVEVPSPVAGVMGEQVVKQPRGHLVHTGRAARAALLPRRVEHEMLQHELAGPREEVEQTDLALGAREAIVLLDADHRQTPAIGVELILHPGQGLLQRKEVLAGGEPLLARDDVRKGHGCLLAFRRRGSPVRL